MVSIEYETAFSPSRWRLFRKCPTAYHLRHHAAWGGWNTDAPEIRRKLHAMKNLQSIDGWTANLASRSMAKAFLNSREEISDPGEAFQLEFRAALHHDLQNIKEKKWPDDPKATALIDEPKNSAGLEVAARHALAVMASIWEWTTHSTLWAHAIKTPLNARTASGQPSAIQIDGIKAWSDPGLSYAHHGEHVAILFRSLLQGDDDTGWLESGLASLKMSLKWRANYEDVRVTTVRHSTDGAFESSQNPPKRMVEAAVHSAMATLTPLEPPDIRRLPLDSDGMGSWDAVAALFPPSKNPDACASCQFKTLCPWNQRISQY